MSNKEKPEWELGDRMPTHFRIQVVPAILRSSRAAREHLDELDSTAKAIAAIAENASKVDRGKESAKVIQTNVQRREEIQKYISSLPQVETSATLLPHTTIANDPEGWQVVGPGGSVVRDQPRLGDQHDPRDRSRQRDRPHTDEQRRRRDRDSDYEDDQVFDQRGYRDEEWRRRYRQGQDPQGSGPSGPPTSWLISPPPEHHRMGTDTPRSSRSDPGARQTTDRQRRRFLDAPPSPPSASSLGAVQETEDMDEGTGKTGDQQRRGPPPP